MKKALTILLLFPLLLPAQYINLRIGQLPFSNPLWNTWKTASKNNDTSGYLKDFSHNLTKIRVAFSNSGTPYDNGINYLTGKSSYPDTVTREGIWWQTTAPTMTVLGLDTGSMYSVTVFASRNRTDLQGDIVKIGVSSISFAADTNGTRVAAFPALKTATGQLVFSLGLLAQYTYVNAVQLIGTPKRSLAHAVISIDSTVINYPNSVVHMNPDGSTGTLAANWSQVFGPSGALFSKFGSSTIYVSNLRPGIYMFELMAQDSIGISDSAFMTVYVNPPKCPVCPAPLKVVGYIVTLTNGIFAIKAQMSDGTVQ